MEPDATELSKIEAAIGAQEALRGILDDAQIEATLSALREKRVALIAAGSGAVAAGSGNTALGERAALVQGSVGRDVITGNIYYGDPTDDPVEALAICRRVLVHASRHLPLGTIDRQASDATGAQQPLGLAQVYIALDTTQQQATDREEESSKPRRPADKERDAPPLPALQAAATHRRVVITGDPGSGKSTFVRHLAHCLAAHVLAPEQAWRSHLSGWPDAELSVLPLPVVLRDFARALPRKLPAAATPDHLWQFISGRLSQQRLGFAARAVERELEAGRVLLLLDGLDEVPTVAQRRFVRDAVWAFSERFGRNRCVVTCRTLAYQPPAATDEPDLRLSPGAFPVFELAGFDAGKIDRFIHAWYGELARVGRVDGTRVDALSGQLQQAVRRPDLWRMAPNPLLLTAMALVHTHKGRLPDARALLYEETIDLLLWRWEEGKLEGAAQAPSPKAEQPPARTLRDLLQQAGLADIDLKQLLWQLAFDTHDRVGGSDDANALADIDELTLRKALVKLKRDDWGWAQQVVEAMRLRAGLLLERSPGVFTFPHRTFQEYLAGSHLSAQQTFAPEAAALAQQGAWWRIPILMAVGRQVYVTGDSDKPLALVGELCPEEGDDSATAWRNAWLAGDVLLEIGLPRVARSQLGRDLQRRVQKRLAALVEDGRLTPRERAEAGDTLARLGDRRRGVGVRPATAGGSLLPDIVWCYVPPGAFWMGSADDDRLARDIEKPQHLVDLPYGYWMARYAVTVAQFQAFVDESGYRPTGDWQRGAADPANRPARYVTWDDAVAFCRRLDEQAQRLGLLPLAHHITLPTEAEWEKAARGGVQIAAEAALQAGWGWAAPAVRLRDNPLPRRRFVWGDTPAAADDLNWQKGVGTTAAVGAFPADTSPYGVRDLAGNVNEWTRTRWGDNWDKPAFRYPYRLDDDRDVLESRDLRVWRGGAWEDSETFVRCASRRWYGPLGWNDFFGFRIVVSPFFSGL